jgi:CheY-like chemotaxis protein
MASPLHKSIASTILIAEDDAQYRRLVEKAFLANHYGGTIIFANDGQETLELLNSHSAKPDIIMLDLNMPKISGGQVLYEIKATSKFKDTPVYILTASNSVLDERVCVLAENIYVKPVDFISLIKITGEILKLKILG